MDIETYRNFCLSLKFTSEGFPFDNETLVFKVGGKLFALCNIEHFVSVNLKCDPERAVELRDQYYSVKPGYHMNKKHWNTIEINLDLSDENLLLLTKHSYDLVFKGLTKKIKDELQNR